MAMALWSHKTNILSTVALLLLIFDYSSAVGRRKQGNALSLTHADVNTRLLLAVADGKEKLVAKLLTNGANPNYVFTNETEATFFDARKGRMARDAASIAGALPPLHLCAWLSTDVHVRIAKLLLERGAIADMEDERQRSIYETQMATPSEQVQPFEFPVNSTEGEGFPPDVPRLPVHEVGYAPALFHAVGLGVDLDRMENSTLLKSRLEMIELLVAHGANLNLRSSVPASAYYLQLADSPLCVAVHLNQVTIATRLLRLGADPNQGCTWRDRLTVSSRPERPPDSGVTPLHIVALAAGRRDSLRLGRVLIDSGAIAGTQTALLQQTPAHVAARRGDHAMLELMLQSANQSYRVTVCGLKDVHLRDVWDLACSKPVFAQVLDVLRSYCGAQRICEVSKSTESDTASSGQDSGGYSATADRRFDSQRCDLDRVDVQHLSVRSFFHDYEVLGRPVILTGNLTADWPAWLHWRRGQLARRYGHLQLLAGETPYGHVYGTEHDILRVDDFLERFMSDTLRPANATPWMMFTSLAEFFKHGASALATDYSLPSYIRKTEVRKQDAQFSLGPRGAGAQFHWHSHAFAALLYGRKRWFISPPVFNHALNISFLPPKNEFSGLFESNHTVRWWLETQYPRPEVKRHVFECVQNPGEVLFLPELWTHATVNVEDTVSLAFTYGSGRSASFSAGSLFNYPFDPDMDLFAQPMDQRRFSPLRRWITRHHRRAKPKPPRRGKLRVIGGTVDEWIELRDRAGHDEVASRKDRRHTRERRSARHSRTSRESPRHSRERSRERHRRSTRDRERGGDRAARESRSRGRKYRGREKQTRRDEL